MFLLGGHLIFWWSSPARVSLFSNRRKMAEKGRRWKMKNQRFLFKNLVTKALKEEIENKNSQELPGLSVRALFPFKHWKCSSLSVACCPILWAVWRITNAVWLPAQLPNKLGKWEHSMRAGKSFPNTNPQFLTLWQQLTSRAQQLALHCKGFSLLKSGFHCTAGSRNICCVFLWARKHMCFCIPST